MEVLIEGIKWFTMFWVANSIVSEIYNWISFYYPLPQNNICSKCLCFWIVTAITFNPFIGAIASFCYYLYDKNNIIKL